MNEVIYRRHELAIAANSDIYQWRHFLALDMPPGLPCLFGLGKMAFSNVGVNQLVVYICLKLLFLNSHTRGNNESVMGRGECSCYADGMFNDT
jgi:hypothetical protein